MHAPVTSADDLVIHLRQMVEAGYTDEEIKSLHPELAQLFNSGSETDLEDEDDEENNG
jgi:ABC-type oligopeptide transport system ATPase subunit